MSSFTVDAEQMERSVRISLSSWNKSTVFESTTEFGDHVDPSSRSRANSPKSSTAPGSEWNDDGNDDGNDGANEDGNDDDEENDEGD